MSEQDVRMLTVCLYRWITKKLLTKYPEPVDHYNVTRSLERLFQEHGRPACLRSDYGPELVSAAVQKWLKGQACGYPLH